MPRLEQLAETQLSAEQRALRDSVSNGPRGKFGGSQGDDILHIARILQVFRRRKDGRVAGGRVLLHEAPSLGRGGRRGS